MADWLSDRRTRRWLCLAAMALLAMIVAAVISSHTAVAAGPGQRNTTPVGSDPTAPSLAPLDARSDETKPIVTLFWIVGAESLVVFVLVCAALFINITRFSKRPGREEEPPQVYGNRRIEIAWTVIPAIILLVAFVATVVVMNGINSPANAESALKVQAIGHQWWWEFKIPAYGVDTANSLHLPDNRLIEIDTTSVDVIHSFWVPQLVRQMDSTPNNMASVFINHPSRGVYPGACYEYCGQGHAWMQLRVSVDSPSAFRAWAKRQSKPLASNLSPVALQGEGVFLDHSCGACHTLNGLTSATGTAGPNLTHVGSRWGIAGGVLSMSEQNLERWISNPNHWKQGVQMPAFPFLAKQDLHALATFLSEAK